ncbi:hypothetical protein RUM43_006237 [Polyplax serrata]|uniref:SHSP domain-containing protein n=1 Tax=Polyplax serrata TaxID=468196 RepID=A0AAN8NSV7_POLSC
MENIPGSSCGPWGMTGQDTFSEMMDREQHGMGPRCFGGLESSNGNFGGRFHDGERHCGTMSRSVHPNGLNDSSLYTTPNAGNSQQNMFGGWYEGNEAPEAFTPSGRRDYSSGNFNQGASFENMNSRGFQGGRPTQMDSVERNFFGDNPLRCVGPRSVAIGNEKDFINSSFYINIDAQGLKPEDLTIGFRDGKMNVAAFKATTKEDGTKMNEMVVREFKLPANVDESSLKSYLQDGILTVEGTLVKKEEEREIPGARPGERPSDEGPTMEN